MEGPNKMDVLLYNRANENMILTSSQKDGYIFLTNQTAGFRDIHSMLSSKPTRNVTFISNILKLTGESVKSNTIDMGSIFGQPDLSRLEFRNGERMDDAGVTDSIVYTLLSDGDIFASSRSLYTEKELIKIDKDFPRLIGLMKQKRLAEMSIQQQHELPPSIDTGEYKQYVLSHAAEARGTATLSFGQIGISTNAVIYSHGKHNVALMFPTDSMLEHDFILSHPNMFSPEYIQEVKNKSDVAYERISIASKLLKRNGFRIDSVYLEGKTKPTKSPSEIGAVDIYQPSGSVVRMSGKNKGYTFRASPGVGIGLSLCDSDTIWLQVAPNGKNHPGMYS
ncbi:hypothetical protein EPN87_04415 [archaeon]|nr:MAG: hypothetical protein EPN87_04415 [archaeon]